MTSSPRGSRSAKITAGKPDRPPARFSHRFIHLRTLMAKKPINIGIVGYGFMGRTHANGFRRVSNFFDLEYTPVLKAACGRDQAKLKAYAEKWGWESTETDWKALIKRDDIDLIDICTPND